MDKINRLSNYDNACIHNAAYFGIATPGLLLTEGIQLPF